MSLERDIAILRSSDLLADLNDDQLRLLAFGAEHLNYQRGRVIFREGQNADCGFVVAEGRVGLSRFVRGDDQTLTHATAGAILGETALITEARRHTTATATEDTQLLRINRPLFRRMLEEYPETAQAMHDKLSSRLQVFLGNITRMEYRFTKPSQLGGQ